MAEEKTEMALTEKIYFEDPNAKITNVRVMCRHLTVPVEKIDSVNVNYKVETFSLAVICLIISASPFLFFPAMTGTSLESLKVPVAGVSVILIFASLLLLVLVFKSYAELVVSVGGRAVKLLSVSMISKEYVEDLSSKISDALMDEKRYRELKDSGQLTDVLKLNPSDTLRLKKIIDEYEELKELKEEFIQKKKSDKK